MFLDWVGPKKRA